MYKLLGIVFAITYSVHLLGLMFRVYPVAISAWAICVIVTLFLLVATSRRKYLPWLVLSGLFVAFESGSMVFKYAYIANGITTALSDKYPEEVRSFFRGEPALLSEDKLESLWATEKWPQESLGVAKDALADDAKYLSNITWTTVGYGDVLPGPDSRQYAGWQGFLGGLLPSVVMAATYTLIQGHVSRAAKREQEISIRTIGEEMIEEGGEPREVERAVRAALRKRSIGDNSTA